MPATKVRSRWVGGDLIFYDASTLAAGGYVFRIAEDEVEIYMPLTITGDVELEGDLTLTTEDISVEQGKYVYLEGQAGASYIRSDAAGDLTINTTTNINLAFGGTDEVRLTATVLSPAVSDGNALGSATLMWSDLFLASAGVINFNNGNCLITHAAGVLTVTGDIVASNAAGPAIEDEAATTTNPTLCPNKAELTTGIGWNTAEIHFVISGVDEVNLSASALSPGVTDSTALGTTALMWSDLFLASAGVINFNNGNVTITHSAGLLTLGGGGLSVGADGAGFDVILYGDRTGSDFFWDQDGQTNGSLNLGTTTVSEGVDLFVHGDTATTYLHWDCSADDLILVGTATQLVIEGTTASTTNTSGSLRTAGGLGVAGAAFIGGLVTADGDTGFRYNGTIVPDANRLDYAIGIGLRGTELTVDLANAVSQNFDPIQMNVNLTASGGAPTSSSTVNMIYQKITHDTVDMPNLRLKGCDWTIDVQKNTKDAYVVQTELAITGNITFSGEASAGAFQLNVGAGPVSVSSRLNALMAVVVGAATVTGNYYVADFGAFTNAAVDAIVNLQTDSSVTATSGILMDIDGAVTYAIDFQGTVSDGWTSGDLTGSDEYGAFDEYSLIPIRIAGVTPTLYIMAAETWKAVTV